MNLIAKTRIKSANWITCQNDYRCKYVRQVYYFMELVSAQNETMFLKYNSSTESIERNQIITINEKQTIYALQYKHNHRH